MLLVAQVASVPTLSDPLGREVPITLHLATPWLYLVLAPLFTLWDGVSMLSMSRLQGFLLGLAILYVAWRALVMLRQDARKDRPAPRFSFIREIRALLVSLAVFSMFVAVGALWHRPMLSLAGVDRGDLVVDFHSHTNASHDVRNTLMGGFDSEANRRWHARAGFDAFFITDHNTIQGPGTRNPGRYPVPCPGTEVSAWRAHIVLLGDTVPVDRRRYNGSLDELLALLETSDSRYGAPSVASLPEYRRNHWDRLDLLIRAGLDGFEIVNAAPKANEITRAERDSVIALARRHNRFVLGVSDTHGWGATSMVWNLVRPRAGTAAEDPCATILHELRRGFTAVRVVERHRLRPDSWWPMWLTPVGVVWEIWRSMGWALAVSWVVWIWIWAILRLWRRAGA
jgi:hypothetical protein